MSRAPPQNAIERFAKPLPHLDTPASAVFVTPASIGLFSGQDTSLTTQGDAQLTAPNTLSAVSGRPPACKQEASYRQHYTDGMPLVSFDKGYGLGQAANPVPTFEPVRDWLKYVKDVVCKALSEKTELVKYIKSHPCSDDFLNMESLVYYNGGNRC